MHSPNIQAESPGTPRLVYWETLIALRSGGVRIALVAFGLLLLTAMGLGVIRTQQRQNDARLAAQKNDQVKTIFQDVLTGNQESAAATSGGTDRQSRMTKQIRMTAKSPYMVSHSTNLWNVSLFPSPLSALSVGSSRAWPDVYPIRGISVANTIKRSDQVRQSSSVYGPFDPTFVIMAIAPLVIIGLTFNVSSQDRESALQNLIVAQTPSLGRLMAIRCFVRAALVISLMAGIVNISLLITFANQLDPNVILNLVIWNVVSILYLLIWAAMSLFVNSFAKSSSTNGAALILLWLILVLLTPRFVSNAVQSFVPTLPESELAEREQSTFDQTSKNADELVKKFQSENLDIEIRTDEDQQMALVRYLLVHSATGKKAPENVASHYSAQLARARYLRFCDWVSPAISFRNQSDQCSGNSELSSIAFASHAAEVQAEVLEVFLKPSIANQECTFEMIETLPRLQETNIPRKPSVLSSLHSIFSMLVWLTILASVGIRRFRANEMDRDARKPQTAGVENA